MKVGVLISGRGSNLQALIDACADADFPAEIVTVISNKPGAGGLELAEAAGIPHQVINHKKFEDRESFDGALDEALRGAGVELICSAGFMRILTDGFVEKWRNKQLNIHPSLLPSFKGLHVHERSIEAGVRISGCTVHFVRAEMDDGPIVAQAAVPVHGDDTASTLAARILVAEHKIYPLALKLVAEGKARVVGEKVIFSGLDEGDDVPILSHPR
ncbi:MAG: phosphoribosylglycinamide formyltransferase [Rhodobiaceae bacterium]|nr:phosphoribosylglycinamide formyltransferase [Rhodobiaceae bacterium]